MRWLLLAGLWLSYLSFGVVAASIAPLVATIRADLELSNSALGSVMGAWQLVYIVSAIPCGMLLDRLGARTAITLGVILIALSAAGRAFADNYWVLLFAVMLFGLGGPIISSGAPKVVTSIFTGSRRGLAMGIYMTGPTLGGVLALTLTHPVLLPMLDDSWRSVMLLWAALAGLGAVVWLLISSLAGASFQAALSPDRDAQGDKPAGTNDLDPTLSPNEAFVIFVNTDNDGISQRDVYQVEIDPEDDGQDDPRELLFSNAFMPNWE